MKQLSTFFSRPFARLLMLLMAIGLCSASAKAVDFGAMELDKEYTIPMFQGATGTFHAPQSGLVTITGLWYHGVTVKDVTDGNAKVAVAEASGAVYTDIFEVKEGHDYSIEIGTQWDTMKITLTMEASATPLEIIDMYPAEGGYYDLASDGTNDLQFTFNQGIKCDQGYYIMYYVKEYGQWVHRNFSNGQIVIMRGTLLAVKDVQTNILWMMEHGFIEEDSDIRIVLNNLQSATGEPLANGKFMDADHKCPYFEFKVGKKPTTLKSVKMPSKFLSFWLPDAEEAKAEVEFSNPVTVGPNTTFQLLYGNPEVENGLYVEDVPYTIEGSKVLVDFSNFLRTPSTMLPSLGSKMADITYRIGGLLDAYGQPVKGNLAGSVGSSAWTMPYTNLERANLACEFTPANGGSLAGASNIFLWMNNLDMIRFSGFNFAIPQEGADDKIVFVPVENCTFTSEGDNEGTYKIPVPAECAGVKGVTVTLADLLSADGFDHTEDVKAIYDKFVVTFANPATGSTFETLESGTELTVETNNSAIYPGMVMVFEIEDLNPDDPEEAMLYTESYMHRNDDGSYTAEIFGNYKMYAGHQYKVTFTAWATEDDKNYGQPALGSDYIMWEGSTAPYQYSPIAFVKISPDTDTRLNPEDRTFVVDFDGYVKLDAATTFINSGMGMTTPLESIVPTNPQTSDEGVSYSDQWTLTVPASYMNSLTAQLELSMKAYDQDDMIVKGTQGKEDQTYFYFSYDVANRYAPVEASIETSEDAVYSVSEIRVSNEKGIMPSWLMPESAAYVTTKGRETVAYVKEVKLTIADDDYDALNPACILVLDRTISTPGAYVLHVPENYFNIGTEFSQQNSAELNFAFAIEERPVIASVVIKTNPEEGFVETLSSIELTVTNYDEINIGQGLISVYRNKQLLETLDAELDWDQWNKAVINLGETYEEAGAYDVFIPEGYFLVGADGALAPAITLHYTINEKVLPEFAVVADPAPGTVSTLSKISLVFPNHAEVAVGAGQVKLHINGAHFSTHDAVQDEKALNKVSIDLERTHTEQSTITLHFPEGYFVLGEEGEQVSPEFTLEYNVDGSAQGIFGIDADGNAAVKVYDTNGVLRIDGDSEAVKQLPAGVYIVNGKKVIVK